VTLYSTGLQPLYLIIPTHSFLWISAVSPLPSEKGYDKPPSPIPENVPL